MKNYKELVTEGRDLLQKAQLYQMKIAKLATEACTIQRGGHKSKRNPLYSVKDYATDIGATYTTLMDWVYTYRNVVEKLEKPPQTQKEWAHAVETDKRLGSAMNPTKKKGFVGKRKATKFDVQTIYNAVSEEKPFVHEFDSVVKYTKHAKTLFSKRDLKLIDRKKLLKCMELLDEISEILNEYLTRTR